MIQAFEVEMSGPFFGSFFPCNGEDMLLLTCVELHEELCHKQLWPFLLFFMLLEEELQLSVCTDSGRYTASVIYSETFARNI